jgi:hypothetical protein
MFIEFNDKRLVKIDDIIAIFFGVFPNNFCVYTKNRSYKVYPRLDPMASDIELMEQRQAEDQRQQAYRQLVRQTEELKNVYPDFDLDTELQNSGFTKLLSAGIDPKTAFEVVHKDEIIPAAMQWAVQQTKAQVANAVAANAARPKENGVSSQSAATVKTDVSKMTGAEIRALREQVLTRGERYSFK